MEINIGKLRSFKLCGTGIGLGLVAAFVTIPLWGIFGPLIISMVSPLLSTILTVTIPIAVFVIVYIKICSTTSSDLKTLTNL